MLLLLWGPSGAQLTWEEVLPALSHVGQLGAGAQVRRVRLECGLKLDQLFGDCA